eukprot:3882223-Pleurochrysis_carterae.AAC.3
MLTPTYGYHCLGTPCTNAFAFPADTRNSVRNAHTSGRQAHACLDAADALAAVCVALAHAAAAQARYAAT